MESPERRRKLVVFGIDGALFDVVLRAAAPHLQAMAATGYASRTTLYDDPLTPTVSGPGWATVATGVWPDKHGVFDNDWGPATGLTRYPDFLTRLKTADSSRTTYAIASWTPLTTASAGQAVFSPKIDLRVTHDGDALGWPQADAKIADDAAAYLKANAPDASFVYFGNVDIAGHDHGAASPQYQAAIEQMDGFVGQVVNAVKSRPTYADEDWTFVVTTDHGHTDAGGHGGSTPAERSSFIIANGPELPTGTPPVAPRNVDILPTVLRHFDIPIDPTWQLDGRPLPEDGRLKAAAEHPC